MPIGEFDKLADTFIRANTNKRQPQQIGSAPPVSEAIVATIVATGANFWVIKDVQSDREFAIGRWARFLSPTQRSGFNELAPGTRIQAVIVAGEWIMLGAPATYRR